jgi:hypothetical protein
VVSAKDPTATVVDPPAEQRMIVDAATQYSSPKSPNPTDPTKADPPKLREDNISVPSAPKIPSLQPQGLQATKRSNSNTCETDTPTRPSTTTYPTESCSPETALTKLMPLRYETCNIKDLVILISSMLIELIRFNDTIPLKDGLPTRFHSRSPPGVPVYDCL